MANDVNFEPCCHPTVLHKPLSITITPLCAHFHRLSPYCLSQATHPTVFHTPLSVTPYTKVCPRIHRLFYQSHCLSLSYPHRTNCPFSLHHCVPGRTVFGPTASHHSVLQTLTSVTSSSPCPPYIITLSFTGHCS